MNQQGRKIDVDEAEKMAFLKRLLVLALASSAARALDVPDYTQEDIDSGVALKDMSKIAKETALQRIAESSSGCTPENVRVRKEWCAPPPAPDRKALGYGAC